MGGHREGEHGLTIVLAKNMRLYLKNNLKK
jgi:hypothetical protein